MRMVNKNNYLLFDSCSMYRYMQELMSHRSGAHMCKYSSIKIQKSSVELGVAIHVRVCIRTRELPSDAHFPIMESIAVEFVFQWHLDIHALSPAHAPGMCESVITFCICIPQSMYI